MTDLKELIKETQINPTKQSWWDKITDPDCLKYMAWIACDHKDACDNKVQGKKANSAAMAKVLKKHFGLVISDTRVRQWANLVEEGELHYERPEEASSGHQ